MSFSRRIHDHRFLVNVIVLAEDAVRNSLYIHNYFKYTVIYRILAGFGATVERVRAARVVGQAIPATYDDRQRCGREWWGAVDGQGYGILSGNWNYRDQDRAVNCMVCNSCIL